MSKNSILTKPQHFHEFFTQFFFWQFFSWHQNCQQLKSPKPQHFHEFFYQKNRQFSREIKVEFLDKKWRFRTVWFSTHFFETLLDHFFETVRSPCIWIFAPKSGQRKNIKITQKFNNLSLTLLAIFKVAKTRLLSDFQICTVKLCNVLTFNSILHRVEIQDWPVVHWVE